MNRRSGPIWLAAIFLSGVAVFLIKTEVQKREAHLDALNREILQYQNAINVLKADWSLLDQPGRIAALARRHLDYQPIAPAQMRTLDGIPWRQVPQDQQDEAEQGGRNPVQPAAVPLIPGSENGAGNADPVVTVRALR